MTKNAGIAALWTFAFTLAGSGLLLLTGWLADVATWVSDEDVEFPSLDPLVKVAVAFALAATIALVNFAYRWVQTKGVGKFLPGTAPTYEK